MFGTTIISADNVTNVIGNNKIFSDTIKNYSAQPHRRVDTEVKIANGVNVTDAVARLRAALPDVNSVLPTPAPEVEISKFTPEGPLLTVRAYTHTDNYWQVYFDTNKALAEVGGANNWPIPAPHQVLRQPS